MKKKMIALMMTAVMIFCPFSALASDNDEEPVTITSTEPEAIAGLENIPAKSYILMEQSTGKVIGQFDAERQIPLGSLTKIMTLLLAFEALDNGKIQETDVVSASEYACSLGGTEIWVEPGEQISISDLLKAVAMGSANDAAVILAEAICGSEEAFVALMNQKAVSLGMNQTTFVNASGIEDSNQLGTARDVALMSRALLQHEKAVNYMTIWMDQIRGGKTEMVNTNRLVRFYEGCTGLKTSFSETTRHSISASASKNGISFIAVAIESDSADSNYTAARTLLDYGFASYTIATPEFDASQILPVKVTRGIQTETLPVCDNIEGVVVPIGREKDIEIELIQSEEITAPVDIGQTVGTLKFKLDGEVISEVPLRTQETIERMTWINAWKILMKMFFT